MLFATEHTEMALRPTLKFTEGRGDFVSGFAGVGAFSCSAPQGTPKEFRAFQCPPSGGFSVFSGKISNRSHSVISVYSVVVSNHRVEGRIKGGRFFLKSASLQTLTNMEGRAECRPLVDGMRIAAVGDAYG